MGKGMRGTYEVTVGAQDAASTFVAGLVVHGKASIILARSEGMVGGKRVVHRDATQPSVSMTTLGGIVSTCGSEGKKKQDCKDKSRKERQL